MDLEILQGKYDRYTIEQRRPLAHGHASVLYEGRNTAEEPVCVKMFSHAPQSEAFEKEVDAQTRLEHPNILSILDYGKDAHFEPGPFIVYPLCTGGTLRDLIAEKPYIPLTEALNLLEQIANALDYAHSSGFLHGDVKPENILFKKHQNKAYLSDFGMSRYFARTAMITTKAGTQGGTEAYLSPEQVRYAKQSTRSDIYSLGIVAFELLTGRLPFDISSTAFQQMLDKVDGKLVDPLEANPNLSEATAKALRCALEVDRDLRPRTATDFCRMLRGEEPLVPIRKSKDEINIPKDSQNDTKSPGFWATQDPKVKIAIITAIIAAIAGIITAAIQIIPEIVK